MSLGEALAQGPEAAEDFFLGEHRNSINGRTTGNGGKTLNVNFMGPRNFFFPNLLHF
jgi:hypothetical protein